jgi:hypothetical protein
MAMAALLLLGACGDSTLAPDEPAATTAGTQNTAALPGGTLPSQPSGPELVCENPPPEEIGLGASITSEVDANSFRRCYWVEIPDGLTTVSFEVTGLTAHLVLNVGYGYLDTLQYHIREFWSSQQDGTDDQVIVVENPQPGPYYLNVAAGGFDDFSPFQLRVITTPETTAAPTGTALPDTDTCARPATEMALGSSISSEVVGRDGTPHARVYFCIQVPEGLDTLTVAATGLEGLLDLLVRLVPANQNWHDLSRSGSERSVVIENPAPGPYYIDLYSSVTGASSPFTLTVESS